MLDACTVMSSLKNVRFHFQYKRANVNKTTSDNIYTHIFINIRWGPWMKQTWSNTFNFSLNISSGMLKSFKTCWFIAKKSRGFNMIIHCVTLQRCTGWLNAAISLFLMHTHTHSVRVKELERLKRDFSLGSDCPNSTSTRLGFVGGQQRNYSHL